MGRKYATQQARAKTGRKYLINSSILWVDTGTSLERSQLNTIQKNSHTPADT